MKNKRLQNILNLISKEESVVADIACDHAFLSIEIAKMPTITKVISSDINKAPLLSGKENILKMGLSNKIDTVLSDGIKHIKTHVDCAIIAGVGGNLITKIISEENIQNIDNLILQPNNNVSKLRRFLSENGFEITQEVVVEERGIFYEIIKVSKGRQQLSIKEELIGPINLKRISKPLIDMIKNKVSYLKTIDFQKIPSHLKRELNILEEFLNEYI